MLPSLLGDVLVATRCRRGRGCASSRGRSSFARHFLFFSLNVPEMHVGTKVGITPIELAGLCTV